VPMSHPDPDTAPMARIPADVDREDRLLGPFTARQTALLAASAVGLYVLYEATRHLPKLVFPVLAVPLAACALVLAVGRRDGISLDRFMLAAWRQSRSPRRLAALGDLPAVTAVPGTRRAGSPASLRLPVGAITEEGGTGILDLGRDGVAALAACSAVNFALRSGAEQHALVSAAGRWLNSLTGPVQIVIRAGHVDLSGAIGVIDRNSPYLPHPAVRSAAADHAAFLSELEQGRSLLARQVILAAREQAAVLGRSRQASPAAGAAAQATGRAVRRLQEAADALAGAGVIVQVLDAAQATAVLAAACDPQATRLAARLAPPGQPVTTAPSALPAGQPDDRAPLWPADRTGAEADPPWQDEPPALPGDWRHPGSGWRAPDERGAAMISSALHPGQAPPPGRYPGGTRRGRWRAAQASRRSASAPAGTGGIGPASIEVTPRFLRLGDGYAATLAVTAYPDEVSAGWLEPLLTHPGQVDVALHVEPVPAGVAADRLRRQRARLESSRRADAGKGRLEDPELEAAAEDAADLAHRIARGQARLFRTSLYVTVHARSENELAEQVAAVRTLVDGLLMQAQPATWRTLQGWVSTLPLGLDQLGMTRTFDTQALASSFPFTSPDLTPPDPARATRPDGVFYGLNLAGTGPVLWDRWAQDTANSVTIARSGAGKSYLTKLEVLRSLYRGVEACVVDPEDEYARLTEATGGAYLPLAIDGAHLNPFDLPGTAGGPADAVVRRALFAHTFISVLLGEKLTAAERAVLDAAISAAYQARGITTDPATWGRPAPLLSDLAGILADHGRQQGRAGQDAASLAARLAPFTSGAHAGIFDQPTSVRPDGHLITFSLKDLPEELKAAGTLLVLDLIWRRVTDRDRRRPRLVVVDEAWLLLREDDGARWLWRMAKSARKHWCGLALVTQDAADVLAGDLGRAVVANSATQILLRQAPQAARQVAAEFGLSAGEKDFLLTAQPGDALLLAGNQRAAFHSLASPTEHQLITTDPEFLARLEAEERNSGGNSYKDLGGYWRSANPRLYGSPSLCRESRACRAGPC
jgi:hypothetical protein